jgi:hypothetical protein
MLTSIASAFESADWETTYGYNEPSYDKAYSAQRTSDGGHIIVGTTNDLYFSQAGDVTDVYLVKTDEDGNETWSNTFGEADIYEHASEIKQTSDGGYIIVGRTTSVDPNVYLIKTDASGTKEAGWPKIFGSDEVDEGESVLQTADGGYLVAGHTSAGGDPNIYLIKTDASGNEVWSKSFGGVGTDKALAINYADNDSYIITGQTEISSADHSDVILMKIRDNGVFIWQQTFGGNGTDVGESVMQTADGGYIIAGEKGIYNAQDGKYRSDVYLIKTDPNGVEIWSKTFGGSGDDRAYSVRQTMDGGYIVGGYSSSFNAASQNAYLIKTDPDGNLLWQNTFGGNQWEQACSAEELDDGSYMVAGYIYSGMPQYDFYLSQYTPDRLCHDPRGTWNGGIESDTYGTAAGTISNWMINDDSASDDLITSGSWQIDTAGSLGIISFDISETFAYTACQLEFTTTGTATESGSATTSTYTLTVKGWVNEDLAYGDYGITFDNPAWPASDSGTWQVDLQHNPDVNNDLEVNFDDIKVYLDYWLDGFALGMPCGKYNLWCFGADQDRNGYINLSDLAVVCENWLANSSLVAHWSMDDNAADTIVADASGNSLNGTAQQNTADISSVGKINNALTFNGSSDRINLGTPGSLENLPLGDFSIAAWVLCEDASASTKDVIFHAFNSNGWLFETRTNATGERQLQFYVATNGNAANFKSAYGSMSNNTWHHVVAVYHAATKTATLYIDSIEPAYQQAVTGTGNYLSDAANEKEIGVGYIGDAHTDYFTGKMDAVRIFNTALTANQVVTFFNESDCTATVPDLTGKNETEAGDALLAVGLTLGTVTSVCSDDIDQWLVIPESITSETDLPCGTPVNIEIAVGPCTVDMPDVLGQTKLGAIDDIITAGLTIGTISYTCDNTYATGIVIGQLPGDPNATIGDPIDLEISSGMCMANLSAFWPMDDNTTSTTVTDYSGNNLDGTAEQNTANLTTLGKINDALSFNGSSDMINLGTPSSLENLPLGDFSITAWVFCEDASASTKDGISHAFNSNGWLFETRTNAAGERQLQFYVATSSNAANFKSAYGSMSNNTWHHVVTVYHAATKTATLYIDSIEPAYQQSVAGTGNYISDAANEKGIGVCYINNANTDHFTGKIDEVRFFDKALSSTEVEMLYDADINN